MQRPVYTCEFCQDVTDKVGLLTVELKCKLLVLSQIEELAYSLHISTHYPKQIAQQAVPRIHKDLECLVTSICRVIQGYQPNLCRVCESFNAVVPPWETSVLYFPGTPR